MGLREQIQKPVVGYSVAGAVLAIAVFVALTSGEEPARRITKVWFYDEDKNEQFIAPDTAIPPITTPSGGAKGVRALVFGCGDCSDPFIGYLRTYPPEVAAEHREAVKAATAATAAPKPGQQPAAALDLSRGLLVRGVEAEWFEATDAERFGRLMSAVNERCAGKRPTQCYPDAD